MPAAACHAPACRGFAQSRSTYPEVPPGSFLDLSMPFRGLNFILECFSSPEVPRTSGVYFKEALVRETSQKRRERAQAVPVNLPVLLLLDGAPQGTRGSGVAREIATPGALQDGIQVCHLGQEGAPSLHTSKGVPLLH